LHLRARWLMPQDGVFLSRDPVESEPPYQYVRGNPINDTDPAGLQCFGPGCPPSPGDPGTPGPPNPTIEPVPVPTPAPPSPPSPCHDEAKCKVEVYNAPVHQDNIVWTGLASYFPDGLPVHHAFLLFTDQNEQLHLFEGGPRKRPELGINSDVLNAIYERVTPEELDLVGRRVGKPVVMLEGSGACTALKCLRNTTTQIKNANLPYTFLAVNSNALVYTLLSRCSLPTVPEPDGVNIGWGLDLVSLIEWGVGYSQD
jgi:hypothetical protein